eukprot:scaffold351407_cov39-Attheya_sp.AAC.1
MGSNLSALTWQSHLGTSTTPPPLTADLESYNSDSSMATNNVYQQSLFHAHIATWIYKEYALQR